MKNEIWKQIPSHPNYAVSSMGRVRGPRGNILVLGVTGWDYLTFHPYARQHRRPFYVHKAVLEAFVGPKPKGKQARHLDGNARNNKLQNLAWGTSKDDGMDRRKHGHVLRGSRCPTTKLSEQAVLGMLRMFSSGALIRTVAKKYKCGYTTARHIKNRDTWKHVSLTGAAK
jgi:hypothetical protein